MSGRDGAREVLGELIRLGWDEAEVFHKRGRSRSLRYAPSNARSTVSEEEGWAVRAGDRRRSFFYAASGAPEPGSPWPEADGRGLRLPPPHAAPPWSAPPELEAPLVGENEATAFFAGLDRELNGEVAGATLVAGTLEDGSSEAVIVSNRGADGRVRRRTATLLLEAGSDTGDHVTLQLAARSARHFNPVALARRLADRLLLARRGESPLRDRGELLLAPPVTAGLLAAAPHLWLGPGAASRLTALFDRRGKLGGPVLTLVDDGRLAGGLLDAPVDGEGQPTREVVLVEEGVFRQPLLAWWHAGAAAGRPSGCAGRPGWRDLPRPGPTHLYLQPDPKLKVAALLESVGRGYYLIDLEGAPRIDAGRGRFAAPVCGFAITAGRAAGLLSGAWLTGSLGAFLAGVVAAARDLTFFPLAGGMVGAPSVLARGLELRRQG